MVARRPFGPRGQFVDGELVCRNHHWRFDAATGQRRGGPECLRRCPLEVRAGQLFARVDALATAGAAQAHLRTVAELPGPRRWPILGSQAVLDLERLHTALERWADRYGEVYRVSVGPHRLVVVSDPVLIQRSLRERPGVYRRMGNVEPVFRELGIDGVFSAEGVDWRPLRRLAIEALSPAHLRSFYPTLRKVAERLHRRWSAAAQDGRAVEPVEDSLPPNARGRAGRWIGLDTLVTIGASGVVILEHQMQVGADRHLHEVLGERDLDPLEEVGLAELEQIGGGLARKQPHPLEAGHLQHVLWVGNVAPVHHLAQRLGPLVGFGLADGGAGGEVAQRFEAPRPNHVQAFEGEIDDRIEAQPD
jgi:hypothetical protein